MDQKIQNHDKSSELPIQTFKISISLRLGTNWANKLYEPDSESAAQST